MNSEFKQGFSLVYIVAAMLMVALLSVGLTWYIMDMRVKESELGAKKLEDRLENLEKQIKNENLETNRGEESNIAMPTFLPEKVVEDFYKGYVSSLGNENYWKNSSALTDEFKISLNKSYQNMLTQGGGGIDLILIAQNTPSLMTFEKGQISGKTATVIVNLHFEPITKRLVSLKLVGGEWKIDGISAIN